MRVGDFDRAIGDYTTAVAINPKGAFAYALRAYAYWKKGEDEAAIADYSRAIEISPTVSVYLNRAYIYVHRRDYDRAIADYTSIIEIDPKEAYVYYGVRAGVYETEGDYDHAIADFTKQIEIKPDDSAAYVRRSTAYAINHNSVAALADIVRINEMNRRKMESDFPVNKPK